MNQFFASGGQSIGVSASTAPERRTIVFILIPKLGILSVTSEAEMLWCSHCPQFNLDTRTPDLPLEKPICRSGSNS